MTKLTEILDFTNVLQRYIRCPLCDYENKYSMRVYLDVGTIDCSKCGHHIILHPDDSYLKEIE